MNAQVPPYYSVLMLLTIGIAPSSAVTNITVTDKTRAWPPLSQVAIV